MPEFWAANPCRGPSSLSYPWEPDGTHPREPDGTARGSPTEPGLNDRTAAA
ncbi:MAG: hypothetical protein JWP70_2071 [Leifsonia sp.]|jgi:hypothetical protein|nr:hypothetical protein [Leifsonia sp.]